MSLLDWLSGRSKKAEGASDTEAVRRIVAKLNQIDPARARHLAAFAYILSRAANADLQITDAETAKMTEVLMKLGGLPEDQALLVAEIANSQNKLFGGTDNFLVTREFREIATEEDRRHLLDCLFAVSAADDAITGEEEGQIWQIASELGFTHEEYVGARLAYSDKRTVLRRNRD